MFFRSFPGIIALDIDGTVTPPGQELDWDVIVTLNQLAQEGWSIIFITGRPFPWGELTLKALPFPYALAVQNGALLMEMPSRKILKRSYLTSAILPKMNKIAQSFDTDYIIYSGYENEDKCYYSLDSMPSSVMIYPFLASIQLNFLLMNSVLLS